MKFTQLDNLQLAHYRAISEEQLIYKTCCYTIRDIATMENNFETAQRTNQMAIIENGTDMWDAAEESSYGGYPREIEKKPLELSFCKKNDLKIKYSELAHESINNRILYTGREMAVRAYNLERSKKEKKFIKPIILWLDGIRGDECIFPNPSNKLTILTEMYNVRGLVTTTEEIKFLKANYRLIVTPDFVKFLPHEYIVISNNSFENIKKKLINLGLDSAKILSLSEYRKRLGVIKNIYCYITFIPAMTHRIKLYIERNGIKSTIDKIKSRIKR